MQEGVNDLVEQLRVAVVVPPPLEAAFRLVPRSAFLVSHAVSLLHTLHICNSHTLQLKHCWHVVCAVFHHVVIWVNWTVYCDLHCIKLSQQPVAYYLCVVWCRLTAWGQLQRLMQLAKLETCILRPYPFRYYTWHALL